MRINKKITVTVISVIITLCIMLTVFLVYQVKPSELALLTRFSHNFESEVPVWQRRLTLTLLKLKDPQNLEELFPYQFCPEGDAPCLELVEWLLEKGFDVNRPHPQHKVTPLQYALLGCDLFYLKWVLKNGARRDLPLRQDVNPFMKKGWKTNQDVIQQHSCPEKFKGEAFKIIDHSMSK